MRILFLLSRFPFPLEKGDKLRAYHQIRSLSQHHEILLFAINDQPVTESQLAELRPFCKEIFVHHLKKPRIALNLARTFFGKKPFQVGYFYTRKIQQALDQVIATHQPEAAFCQLIRTAEYVKGHPELRLTLDYMDVFSKAMERRAKVSSLFMKIPVNMEHRRLLRYENEVFTHFDQHTIITEQDRDLIPHPERGLIHVVPNGVDHAFFHPMDKPKQHDLLFMGNMAYPPNVESSAFLVNQILPLVRKQRPETTVLLAGATPAPEVKALAGNGVTVTGWLDDVRDAFAESRLMIAPMLISVGLQNKILQAMAMKIPVVSSKLANNAIRAEENTAVRVAVNPQEYADHILDLLNHPEKAARMAENAYQFVNEKYDWEKVNAKLAGIITQPKS